VRVRVNITDGGQIDADNTAVVVVRPFGTDDLNGPWGDPIPPSFLEHASI
jgi:hypothetical protein